MYGKDREVKGVDLSRAKRATVVTTLGLSNPNNLVGQTIGEYEILSRLGVGGMGAVYEGRHPVIGKRVAVKVLLPQLSRDADTVERFLAEARAVNEIRHRGIVDIFAFGQLPEGSHYFVMELLQGEGFDRIVKKRGPLPVGDVLRWAVEVCEALDAAHNAGVVHRDIKPSNLFLVDPGRGRPYVKLLDFGIAKLGPRDGSRSSTSTQASVIIGTPDYLSPEQAKGFEIVPATDLYALGIVLFELMTGRRPFVGQNALQTMWMHVESPPPKASSVRADIEPDIDTLLLQLMEKDPANRPPSAEALLLMLDPLLAKYPAEGVRLVRGTGSGVRQNGPATPSPSKSLATPAASAMPQLVVEQVNDDDFEATMAEAPLEVLLATPSPERPPSDQNRRKLLELSRDAVSEAPSEQTVEAPSGLTDPEVEPLPFEKTNPNQRDPRRPSLLALAVIASMVAVVVLGAVTAWVWWRPLPAPARAATPSIEPPAQVVVDEAPAVVLPAAVKPEPVAPPNSVAAKPEPTVPPKVQAVPKVVPEKAKPVDPPERVKPAPAVAVDQPEKPKSNRSGPRLTGPQLEARVAKLTAQLEQLEANQGAPDRLLRRQLQDAADEVNAATTDAERREASLKLDALSTLLKGN
jgi:serine/threonine protein kinase